MTMPSLKEVQGIAPFMSTVQDTAEELELDIRLDAIIPCAVPPANAGRVYSEALAWLDDNYGELLTPTVRRTALVAEAASNGVPVTAYVPHEDVSDDCRKVLADLQDGECCERRTAARKAGHPDHGQHQPADPRGHGRHAAARRPRLHAGATGR
ncbi:hypothetical protein [Luteipulveratus halotolerans]|uniref:hypothetical protein n=1 Tax=Luteipulveratus halotolerans TaxID=1631356 RepID=UPI0012F741BA|nr:hypothetical protein [Luteipulveratus halotolerans]